MVAVVDPGPPFRVIERRALFSLGESFFFHNNSTSYSITKDDRTFLMAREPGSGNETILVTNFFEELKRRVPN